MTRRKLYILSTGLILPALALIVIGLESGSGLLWGSGLAAITLAMLASLASRWNLPPK